MVRCDWGRGMGRICAGVQPVGDCRLLLCCHGSGHFPVQGIRCHKPLSGYYFLISGIFPLVPGAGIYWTVYYLVTDQLGLAVHTGYAAVKAAVAIVLGIVAVFELPQGMFAWTAGKLRRIPGFCSRSRG